MSFTDFQLKNLSGKVAPNLVGLDNYIQIIQSKLNIPNFEFLRLLFFNLFWAFSNVVIHVVLGVAIALLLNVNGLRFKQIYRALFILPVIIPPIIVATVWRHLFDQDNGAINLILAGHRRPLQDPAGRLQDRLARPGRRPDLVHPAAARLLRAADGEHVARLAAQLGRRHRRAPERAAGPVRGGRDGRRQRLAAVQGRDPAVPPAGDAAVRDLRLRRDLQPLLPVVLHVGRRPVRADRAVRHRGLQAGQRLPAVRRRGGVLRHPLLPAARRSPSSPTGWRGQPPATRSRPDGPDRRHSRPRR